MKRYFYWLIFLYKYYLPSFKIYTKPIKTNFIKHQDVSAIVDPFIQAYIEFSNDYENLDMNEYNEYFIENFEKLLKNHKNKTISAVFIDVKAYFSSKVTRYDNKLQEIKEKHEELANIIDNSNVYMSESENMRDKLSLHHCSIDDVRKHVFVFLYNSLPQTDNYKSIISLFQNKIVNTDKYDDFLNIINNIRDAASAIYNNLIRTAIHIPVTDEIIKSLTSYVTEINNGSLK